MLTIDLQTARQLYPKADDTFKAMLEKTFGDNNLVSDIKDRVKSYEDACRELGITPLDFDGYDHADEIAYIKLKTIARALNEGWTPDWTKSNQYKYYPWFDLSSGSGLSYYGYCGYYYTGSYVGSRLCFRSSELAMYAGKQFLSLYKDFMVI